MPYINANKGSLIAFISFAIAALFIKGVGVIPGLEVILTVSTFLFAILAGFFISRLNNRYNDMREVTAEEDAHFLSLYKTTELIGGPMVKSLRDLIDKYYTVALDPVGLTYYKHNAKHYMAMYVLFKKNRGRIGSSYMTRILEIMHNIEQTRNKSSVLEGERLTRGQWFVIILLAIIVLVSMFLIQESGFFLELSTVLLSTILVLVLLTLRDLENLQITKEPLLLESGEEVLELIGKPRYYNQEVIDFYYVHIPDHIKEYRVGIHRSGVDPEVKLVKR